MKIFQNQIDRLVNYLKKSRDAWKERALQKQQKIRSLEIKVRDLTASRDHWKKKAKKAENAQHEISKNKSFLKKICAKQSYENTNCHISNTNLSEDKVIEGELIKCNEKTQSLQKEKDPIALLCPACHSYPVLIIQLAVEQIIYAGSSLRGSEKHFEILNRFVDFPLPCFSSIRQWLFRIGLYVLQKEQPYRSDWIFIVDSTVELGAAKCLLILGIPHAHLPTVEVNTNVPKTAAEKSFVLQHNKVEVLSMTVLKKINGDVVNDELEAVSERVGVPKQIIADHGSDIKKGIEIYQQKHVDTIYTYDITHQMALLLKHHLEDDERYQLFVHECSTTTKLLQQTALNFLKPPTARAKARWLNVAAHVQWAQQILLYQAAGDFSAIDSTFVFDSKTYRLLLDSLDYDICKQLTTLLDVNFIYKNRASFICTVCDCIGEEAFEKYGVVICEAADRGRRYFEEKLGWLTKFKSDVVIYSEMIELVHNVQKQVKQKGLSRTSKLDFENSTKDKVLTARAYELRKQIMDYLTQEGEKVPDGQIFLGTSDVIESIFGKYKQYAAKKPLKEIGKTILTIPLLVTKITSQLVKEALESVSTMDLKKWADELFGPSALSKRKSAITLKNNIKVV